MCELLSAYNMLEPSLAFNCRELETFVKESYFDNNYNNDNSKLYRLLNNIYNSEKFCEIEL